MNRYQDKFQALRDRQEALPPRRFKTKAEAARIARDVERALCPPIRSPYAASGAWSLDELLNQPIPAGIIFARPRAGMSTNFFIFDDLYP